MSDASKPSYLVGLRNVSGKGNSGLAWDIMIADEETGAQLALHGITFRNCTLSSDIVKKSIAKDPSKDDMYEHFLYIGEDQEDQKDLKLINVRLKRIGSRFLTARYYVRYKKGFLRTGEVSGEVALEDQGVCLMAETREEIENVIREEYEGR